MSGSARRWRPVLLLAVVAADCSGAAGNGGTSGAIGGPWRRSRRRSRTAGTGPPRGSSTALLAWQPDSDEALYLLGTCEMARGRAEAAAEAWARVPPGSPFAPRAILGRMQLQMERGRLAEAEQIIKRRTGRSRIDGSSLPILLGPIYCQQGRLEETLRLIERAGSLEPGGRRGFGAGHQPGSGAHRSPTEPRPDRGDPRRPRPGRANGSRRRSGLAGESQPGDPRRLVRRGRAVARRLPAASPRGCPGLARPAGLGGGDESRRGGREALKHLPAEVSTPAQVHKLAAWFAARRGDVESERRALERLIAADPADFAALDRLAELAVKNGQPDRAAELRREKTEIERRSSAIPATPRAAPADARRGGDGPPGRAARPTVRGQGLPDLAVAVDPDRDDLRRDLARLNQRAETIEGRDVPWPICSRPSSARGPRTLEVSPPHTPADPKSRPRQRAIRFKCLTSAANNCAAPVCD